MTRAVRTPARALTASLAALLVLALVITASFVRVTPAHALTTTPAPSAPPSSPPATSPPDAAGSRVPVPASTAPVESRLVAAMGLPAVAGTGASGSGFAAAVLAASWAPAPVRAPVPAVGTAPVHAFTAMAADPAPAPTDAQGVAGTTTLSAAAYDFLTQALGLPLASGVLSGTVDGTTLTVTAGAPHGLALNLPGGAGTFTLDPATITVDTATKQLTLTASGHADNGIGGALTVTIAKSDATELTNAADLSTTLTVSAIPVLGTTVDVTGNLRYTGGHLGGSIAGALAADAPLTSGATLLKGATITLDTAAGLAVNGTVALGGSGFSVGLKGTISGLEDWSLTVTQQAGAVVWQPVSGLSISPNVTGTITDTKGTISFDVSTTNVVNWVPSAGSGVSLAVNRIEISDKAPGADLSCPDGVEQGHLWIDVAGTLSYTPDNLSGSAEACVDPAAQAFKISTTINPGSLIPSGAGFTIDGTTLAVQGNIKQHTFAVTGSASLTFTTMKGNPKFALGVLFQSDGTIVAGATADLSSIGFTGSGNLFLANKALKGFDPKTILPGTTAAPFDLQPGIDATISYTLADWLAKDLAKAKIPVPAGSVVQGVASFSGGAFSLSASLSFPGDGAHLFDANGTKVYLQSATIGLSLGDTNSASLSGQVLLALPPQIPGGQPSSVRLGLNASFTFTTLNLQLGLSLSGACGAATCAWKDAFGISGLSVEQLAGTLGIELDTAIPLPTLSIQAKNVVLPAAWSQLIGVVPGTTFSLAANLNLVQPVLTIDIAGNPVALKPLSIATSNPNVANSFTVNHASLVLAPLGGTTAGGDVLTPGVSVLFDATVLGHPIHVDGGVGLVPPTIDANVQFGRLDIGSARFDNTTLHLHVGVNGFDFKFSGGVTDPHGFVLQGTVDLTASTSLVGGSVSLTIAGGLPQYLAAGGSLSGSISASGSGMALSASGYGYLIVGGQFLGYVSFNYSWDNGVLWQQLGEAASQVAQAFQNAYGWTAAQTTAALQQLQYNAQQTFSALNAIGDNAGQVIQAISNAFHTGRYFIWSQDGQVLDVSGGSTAPSAWVIQYPWHGGANQEWAVLPTDGGYSELVNVNSGQCLTVDYLSASAGAHLVQYPCNGWTAQQWSFNSGGGYTGITNRNSGLQVDINGASVWPGTYVDQWYANGGWNQTFSFSPGW